MYSLNLGQIQFDPSHTIDEHRPQGYTQEIANSLNASTRYFEESGRSNATEDEALEVQISTPDSNLSKSDSGPEIPEFLEIHDPKHRHPRESHGE